MAIIKCPECQNEISDKALSCPKCGYPIASETVNSQTHTAETQTSHTPEDDKEETVYTAQKNSNEVAVMSGLFFVVFIILVSINRWIGMMSLIYLALIEIYLLLSYAGQKELYFTNKKVVGCRGIIAQKSLDSPLDKINNISVIKAPLGKSIEITTSSDKHTFYFIGNAEEFREKLLKEIDIYKDGQMKKYVDLMQQQL